MGPFLFTSFSTHPFYEPLPAKPVTNFSSQRHYIENSYKQAL
jgi:hypothetical protein